MTKDEVNALPDEVRKYIHDLEARCDPAGEVQRIAILEEHVRGLTAKIIKMEWQMKEGPVDEK